MIVTFMIKLSRFPTRYPMITRRTPRLATVKSATLVLNEAAEPEVSCHVVEISAGGARVVTNIPVKIPEFLRLRFSDGVERQVRRCWTKGREIGFEFIRSEPG